MKLNILNVFSILTLSLFLSNGFAQGIAINETNSPPNASAMLDVSSTTKGVLIPRMTQLQRNAIVSPENGLMIFQSDGTSGYYFNSGNPEAPFWRLIGYNANVSSQWITSGSSIHYNLGNVGIGTTSPTYRLCIGSASTGIDYPQGQNLSFHTNLVERIRITSNGRVGIGTSSPATTLDVDGSISGSSLTVTGDLQSDNRLAVGGAINASYRAIVYGNLLVETNIGIDGNARIDGTLNSRGIVVSHDTEKMKIFFASGTFTLTLNAFQVYPVDFNIVAPQGVDYSKLRVMISNFESTLTGSFANEWQYFNFIPGTIFSNGGQMQCKVAVQNNNNATRHIQGVLHLMVVYKE